MNKKSIIIATIKSWNILLAQKLKEKYETDFNITILSHPDQLRLESLNELNPDYIFFPHWSWIIPDSIYEKFECVVFHMTDLPYGRGGSPLQNLILNKKYQTKISAIKVVKDLDAGPIYLKEDLDISDGNADQMFQKASRIIFNTMIPEFLNKNLSAKEQVGDPVLFKRRKPDQSDITQAKSDTVTDVYDFIRMLDGEGYPKAFIQIGDYKLELSHAQLNDGKLKGQFEVKYEK